MNKKKIILKNKTNQGQMYRTAMSLSYKTK